MRFDPVWWIEVMALREHLEPEVREDASQPLGFLAEVVGVTESAECEVRRAVEAAEGLSVQVVGLEGANKSADGRRALSHPRRRWTCRRLGWLHVWPKLQAHECGHEVVVLKAREPRVLSPQRPVSLACIVPVASPRRLEQGDAPEALGVRSRDCQRDGTAA